MLELLKWEDQGKEVKVTVTFNDDPKTYECTRIKRNNGTENYVICGGCMIYSDGRVVEVVKPFEFRKRKRKTA